MNKTKALFLDRDGVINVDSGYVHKKEDFVFIDGVCGLIGIFVEAGYKIFVVTNQSGIGRGYYSEEDFKTLTDWMIGEFDKQGIEIAGLKYCPHLPDDGCECRKPRTQMVDQIAREYNIDLTKGWMIGDKPSDIELAKNSGIRNSIYIGSADSEADYSFESMEKCRVFLEQNKDKIAS